jgi:hypothetical protein
MTTVFVGGSRRVSRLSTPIRERLDRIIEKGLPVLIGDANGADKAIQQYLHNRSYQNVKVFCSGDICRNNVGRWQLRKISANSGDRGVDFYSAKDRVMAREATIGFMVWDGESAGTLLNVFRLLGQQKKAVIYNVAEKQFLELRSHTQWKDFISRCGIELRRKIKERAALEDLEYESPALFPFEKSINRYAGK